MRASDRSSSRTTTGPLALGLAALLGAGQASAAGQANATGTAPGAPETATAGRPQRAADTPRPARPPRALMVEHDDLSLIGTVRHLIRATVPAGLTPDELRRCLDQAIDEERIIHPQVDATAVYLYEEQVYARYTGRATPLAAALAHADWAPAGDWTRPARSVSGLDNRTVYTLPRGK